MTWKLNSYREAKRQKIVKIKRKPEKKRAAGVISGGRDSEAAEYISGLQVTEINWSRQHPSVIPHFTSLLLTRRTKILTHKVQPRVCVCPRTCRAVCEHVRCAMCDVRTRPLPLELAGGRVEQRYASVCRWECVWKLPARWSVKPPSSCAADRRICFKVSFYKQKLRLISQVRTQREKETGGQRDFQTDRKPPLFLSAKNGGLTSYPRWAGKKCLPPAAQYVGMCDCSMKIINQKREGLKSRYALFSYKEMSAMLLWAHK